ncbi:MAG: adenylosuccinate lyase [Nitrososphaerales archaeon]
MFDYDDYLSVFTWRYGSKEMRKLFSEVATRAIWRRIWLALAEAEAEKNLVSKEELEDIRAYADAESVNINRAHEIERQIKHDLMAEIKVFAEQAKIGGGKIHLGATSADIEDNADALKIRKALDIILTRLVNCLDSASKKIKEYRALPCMGWTHLQPAEPTTVGYRIAQYAQDLVTDVKCVEFVLNVVVKGKGLKGSVGTSSSFKELLSRASQPADLESAFLKKLGLESYLVSTQTYPRKLDFLVLSTLSSIAQSAHRFAFDVRLMQSPVFGEWSEPIGEKQVGSSAMPFKRNPVLSERICSLARFVSMLPQVAYINASSSLLERTLDDSANRRIIIPEGFLAVDEILILYDKVMRGLQIYERVIERNLRRFAPFSATERLLMQLVKAGESRQEMHELIRGYAFKAWDAVMQGAENPLASLLSSDSRIASKLNRKVVEDLLGSSGYGELVGDAPERCLEFVQREINPILERYSDRIGIRADSEF